MADSVIAFALPLYVLLMNTFVGVAPLWKWLYLACGFLVFSLGTTIWNFHILHHETELASFKRVSRLTGYSFTFVTGIPFYALTGWADQHGFLSPLLETIVAWVAAPSALFACHIFLRDWQRAITDSHHWETTAN